MMKKWFSLTVIVLALSQALTLGVLSLLPDTIPVHYSFSGAVDRFGSKYEFLLMNGILLVLSAILLVVALAQKEQSNRAAKILCGINLCSILFFTGLDLVFLFWAWTPGTNLIHVEAIVRFLTMLLGCILVTLGSWMPRIRRNRWMGFRTRFTLSSDLAWQKSQRMSGILAIVCGMAEIILSFFGSTIQNLVLIFCAPLCWLLLSLLLLLRMERRRGMESK